MRNLYFIFIYDRKKKYFLAFFNKMFVITATEQHIFKLNKKGFVSRSSEHQHV